MKVTIIGLGLIGGSLAIDMRNCGFASEIVGVDNNETHATQALARRLVDRVLPLAEAVQGTQLVILAIPVHAIVVTLPKVMALIDAQTVVTDMGSTKELICRSIENHPRRAHFVASHPMAGTENSGPLAAILGMFAQKTAVICDRERSADVSLARVEDLYRCLDMRLISMSAAEHDLHVAYVSHLSHISSFVLANTVLDKEKDVTTIFDLAGGGFASTVRLGKSSPDMWTPIFEQNRENVINALSAYIEHLTQFHWSLKEGRFDVTREMMENANQVRRVLDTITRGTDSGEPKKTR